MLVRCEAIISPLTGTVLSESAWVTVGSEYLVVGILVGRGRPSELRIVDDSGEPSLWPMAMFTVIEGHLPPDWEARGEAGALAIEPREFLRTGFWERYWDSSPRERGLFSAFVERASAEHNRDSGD